MPVFRIAIVGLSVEALMRSPLLTDIPAMQIYRGAELPANDLWLVRGILDRLQSEPGVEACPLLWATALPGGPLTRRNYESIKRETLQLLSKNGPFHGVAVANHGALEVDGFDHHADTDFLVAIRDTVGENVPIGVALDLHGHMTSEMLQAGTVFSALRTAPHRDDRETGYRAADQLLRVLRAGLRPKTTAVHIPMLVTGEAAVTTAEPGKSLYAGLKAMDACDGVMEANILVGFAFNDRPWTGMTALVTCENDAKAARLHAQALAAEIWDRRHEFVLSMETAPLREGLLQAAKSAAKPVYVSDSGDNSTAGAPGDLTFVLQDILDLPEVGDAVVLGIYGPQAVRDCLRAGVGREITLNLGSEHISARRTARIVTGVIEGCGAELILGGFQPYRSREGAWARIRIGGTIATFHEFPIGITTPAHLEAMGIDPTRHAIYVVKLGYLHPQLEDIAARHILLLTEGAVALDLRERDWKHVIRPVFPLDAMSDWSPEQRTYGSRRPLRHHFA